VGYYTIYLITPYDLTWHLSHSASRIVIQMVPLITFGVLAASRTPESLLDFTHDAAEVSSRSEPSHK
jgi:hypothetical protein